MPSTHLSLHYHIVFSTKNRLPLIKLEWRNDLHSYLGGIVKTMNGVPLAVGGIEDHVHMLIGLRSTHRLDYVVRDVKSGSSGWAHGHPGQKSFGWQGGYFGATVSPSQIERVRKYVLNQEEHHKKQSFQDEYIELLKLNGVVYDERYVW